MAGLGSLYLFPVYQTREQYKAATGKDAPLWNPNKPVKSWEDTNAPVPDEDGDVRYLMLALAADGRTPAVKEGRPYLRLTRVKYADAVTVNIPEKEFHNSLIQDAGALSPFASLDVPVPCRELAPHERLKFGFGATVQVEQIDKAPPPIDGTPVVDSEVKQLLLAINSKLDVLLAK